MAVFQYWGVLSQKLESPELYLLCQINRQATIDYLEEPDRIRSDGHIYVNNKHRLSAYTWLFGKPTYYGNLEFMCDTFGPDLKTVRSLIVEAALCHERIPLDDSGRTKLDADPLYPENGSGGDRDADSD